MPFHRMFAAVAALLCLSGCVATPAVMEAIDPSRTNSDRVEVVRSAWRAETGQVVICVTGHHAGSYTFWTTDYAITLPAAVAAGDPDLAPMVRPALRRFTVSQNDVQSSCPRADGGRMGAAEMLPVSFVQAPGFRGTVAERSDAELLEILESQAEAPAILVIGNGHVNEDPDILYLADPGEIGGIEAIEIHRGDRKVDPNPSAIAVLPLAVAADVVLVPAGFVIIMFGTLFGADFM